MELTITSVDISKLRECDLTLNQIIHLLCLVRNTDLGILLTSQERDQLLYRELIDGSGITERGIVFLGERTTDAVRDIVVDYAPYTQRFMEFWELHPKRHFESETMREYVFHAKRASEDKILSGLLADMAKHRISNPSDPYRYMLGSVKWLQQETYNNYLDEIHVVDNNKTDDIV